MVEQELDEQALEEEALEEASEGGAEDDQESEPAADESGEEPNEGDSEEPEGDGGEESPEDEGESSGLDVTIGDEQEAPKAGTPEWVRNTRKANRELRRENARLRKDLAATKPATDEPVLGPKPTLQGCEFDSEKYDKDLAAWYDKKAAIDQRAALQKAKQESDAAAWNAKMAAYTEGKGKLGARDFADAEAVVLEALSVTQQGVIVQGSSNPALVVYALGKNEKQLQQLAKISDPVEFAFAVAKLEAQVKVKKRGVPATAPESSVSGGTRGASTVDSTLERLRKEAERTGDYSKVTKYKREKSKK